MEGGVKLPGLALVVKLKLVGWQQYRFQGEGINHKTKQTNFNVRVQDRKSD